MTEHKNVLYTNGVQSDNWTEEGGSYVRKDGVRVSDPLREGNWRVYNLVPSGNSTEADRRRYGTAQAAMQAADTLYPLEVWGTSPMAEHAKWAADNPLPWPPTSYTDDNPKTAYGDKKPPLHLVPPALTLAAAGVFKLGARKYGPYNWREKTVSSSVYQGAAMRHLLAWWDGEDIDPESGESHLAHAAACIGILLDAEAIGKLNDNRPPKGAAAEIIREKEDTIK